MNIVCSGTGDGNPGKLHKPGQPGPVLGTLGGDTPVAAWGYLCEECTATWNATRALHPGVPPRNFLRLVPRPAP